MNKKAQAAMEFLMTYGWAIIIVLAAIGALAYFGVLSPSKLLPERTIFPAPIPNADNALLSIGGKYIEIAFTNSKGVTIDINDTTTISTKDCTNSPVIDRVVLTDGTVVGYGDIDNGQGFRIRWNCTSPANTQAGDRFKADNVLFYYKNTETGQTFPQTGSIDGKWSS